MESGDKVPDEKTVWLFRERLTKSGVVEMLFSQFIQFLEEKELIFNEGRLIDASFTIAPRQRNTREENEKIKKIIHFVTLFLIFSAFQLKSQMFFCV